jgi:diguanylate cyclase (GGDEF)-like protein
MDSDLKQTILIVDDERANLLALKKILSPDYVVSLAKSGKLALALVLENKPDLVLLDILMPDMDGFEVLARLKDAEETTHIPVIFVTGLDNEQDEEKGFRLGAVDYIKKPFKGAIVKARVNTHLQIVRQMHTIEELSMTDPLTGLPNRRRFDDHMQAEWKRAIRAKTPISFMMMDIDKFKTYNDTYGHPQGDRLLQATAKIFMSSIQRPGDLAARLGGEEFGLLLPETDLDGALHVAERIRAAIEANRVPTADGDMTTATISIGVVSLQPESSDTIPAFLTQADNNLYTAKETGRNRVFAGG